VRGLERMVEIPPSAFLPFAKEKRVFSPETDRL